MNISVAIASSDREYMERLSEALGQYEELAIHVYTGRETLTAAMESNHFDVLLFDPDLSEDRLPFQHVELPICSYSDEAKNTGLYPEEVKTEKYQRVSNIYKQIIREYAERAGEALEPDRSQKTVCIAVYSPIGGSGKTAASLAVGSRLAKQGKSVLFFSAEQLDSSSYINPRKEEGLVALIEAASDKKVNFELKLKGLLKTGNGGISYLEGFERLADFDAVTAEEMKELLMKIRRCGLCDVLVIDMESSLHALSRTILEFADKIVIVERPGELSGVKMELFAKQALVNEYKKKMVLIRNFAESGSRYSNALSVPEAGTIHNYGNLTFSALLNAIEANGEIRTEKLV